MANPISVAIVGASGAVGQELLHVLEKRGFPVGELRLYGGARSAGTSVQAAGAHHPILHLSSTADPFKGIDVVFFSAGGDASRAFVPQAEAAGCAVIDNSSAFRADPSVPIIVPPVNGDWLQGWLGRRVFANPNCTTAIMLTALAPLHRRYNAERAVVTSFQAVSGAGNAGMQELAQQAFGWAGTHIPPATVFPHRIVHNLIPAIGTRAGRTDDTTEEAKMESESRKILRSGTFRCATTCVRVPVFRCHTVSVTAQFSVQPKLEDVRRELAAGTGLRLVDDLDANVYPMPLHATMRDDVFVGRVRAGSGFERSVSFVATGDQLLRGAALNAVEIAELLCLKKP